MQISGWGSTVPVYQDPKTHKMINKTTLSRFLKEADIFDYSQEGDCRHEQDICVRNEQTNDTACLGDSGKCP